MNDQECTEAYERLLKMLVETRLGWVAEQVQEQVRLGRTVEREIVTLRDDRRVLDIFTADEVSGSYKKGPTATFPVTVEYQPAERLTLLLNAIEHVVVNTADMEQHLLEFFSGELEGWKGIKFDSDDQEGASFAIDRRTATHRLNSAKRLKTLLHQLPSEASK